MTKSLLTRTLRQFIAVCVLLIASASFAQDQVQISVSTAPGVKQIPANTLRLYVDFSESMKRGQVARYIHLEDHSGQTVLNPFLNLGTELWNDDHTRLTLLFDPGRVKLGVGPSVRYGPPLNEGETVYLVIGAEMKSVSGESLRKIHRTTFSVGAAERRPVTPLAWRLQLPKSKTTDTLVITFDRLMDSAAASRFIRVRTSDGDYIAGDVACNGETWRFQPVDSWKNTDYEVVIHPSLEDISGNTPYTKFDKVADSSAKREELVSLRFGVLSDSEG